MSTPKTAFLDKTMKENYKKKISPLLVAAKDNNDYVELKKAMDKYRLKYTFDDGTLNNKDTYWENVANLFDFQRGGNRLQQIKEIEEIGRTGTLKDPKPYSQDRGKKDMVPFKSTTTKEGVDNRKTRKGLEIGLDGTAVVPQRSASAPMVSPTGVDDFPTKNQIIEDNKKIPDEVEELMDEDARFRKEEELEQREAGDIARERRMKKAEREPTAEEERDFQRGLEDSPNTKFTGPPLQNLVMPDTPKGEPPSTPIRKMEEVISKGTQTDTSDLPNESIENITPSSSTAIDIDENKQRISKVSSNDSTNRKIDGIPADRLRSTGKSAEQLRNDINYFFREFPNELKNMNKMKKSLSKMTQAQLERFHKRIIGVLKPSDRGGKKVGIVIDAEEYIKRKMNELMVDKAVSDFKLPNLEPIGSDTKKKDTDARDIGSYEIKRGEDGGLNSQKEPIYRYIPTTQDDQLAENDYNYEQSRKPNRISLPKPKMRNLTQTAKREIRLNPFAERQSGHRINIIQ